MKKFMIVVVCLLSIILSMYCYSTQKEAVNLDNAIIGIVNCRMKSGLMQLDKILNEYARIKMPYGEKIL